MFHFSLMAPKSRDENNHMTLVPLTLCPCVIFFEIENNFLLFEKIQISFFAKIVIFDPFHPMELRESHIKWRCFHKSKMVTLLIDWVDGSGRAKFPKSGRRRTSDEGGPSPSHEPWLQWKPYVGNFMMVTDLRCWRLFSLCWWFFSVKLVIKNLKLTNTDVDIAWSPTSMLVTDVGDKMCWWPV